MIRERQPSQLRRAPLRNYPHAIPGSWSAGRVDPRGAVCGVWNKSAVKMIQAFLLFCKSIVIYKRHGVKGVCVEV